jgi:nitroimidazol reductase NimA-like FMN-containing flavoprotein (pyridoxamine 5'-phosphate oxidase superfamily)
MISEGYVTNGATVYISSRDAKACEKAVQELNAIGRGKAYAIPADFYKEEECKRLAEEIAKRESSKLVLGDLLRRRLISRFIRASCPREQLRVKLGCSLR